MNGPTWRPANLVELIDGYTVADAQGRDVGVLTDVRIAIEGGFVHVDVASTEIQTVSAPAFDGS